MFNHITQPHPNIKDVYPTTAVLIIHAKRKGKKQLVLFCHYNYSQPFMSQQLWFRPTLQRIRENQETLVCLQ